MTKKKIKKLIAIATIAGVLATTPIATSAGKVWFTLTLHHGGSVGEPDDAKSKRIKKNTDGDAKFYITQESFGNHGNSAGCIKAYSQKTATGTTSKTYIPLRAGRDGIHASAKYGWSSVPGGIYYNIVSYFGGGSINNATGWYTP